MWSGPRAGPRHSEHHPECGGDRGQGFDMSCGGSGGALLFLRTPEQALMAAPQHQGSQSLFLSPPMVIALFLLNQPLLAGCASHFGLDLCSLTTSLSHNMTLICLLSVFGLIYLFCLAWEQS